MSNFNEQDQHSTDPMDSNKTSGQDQKDQNKPVENSTLKTSAESATHPPGHNELEGKDDSQIPNPTAEGRPVERNKSPVRTGARGTAAMDPQTRQEVARKGGLAVSRNKQHMAEIGRKGGQSVSKNREHMAQIGRKGGAASRGHR